MNFIIQFFIDLFLLTKEHALEPEGTLVKLKL